jgi:hypothetical protein
VAVKGVLPVADILVALGGKKLRGFARVIINEQIK